MVEHSIDADEADETGGARGGARGGFNDSNKNFVAVTPTPSAYPDTDTDSGATEEECIWSCAVSVVGICVVVVLGTGALSQDCCCGI